MNEVQLLSVFVLVLLIYTIKSTQETSKNCNYIFKTPDYIKKNKVEKFQFENFDNDPVNDRVNENFLQNLDNSMNYTESLWNTPKLINHPHKENSNFYDTLNSQRYFIALLTL